MADKTCDHDFEYEKNWRNNIQFDNCLRIPIVCSKCGLKADETWTDFLNTDRKTGDEIR